MLVSLSGKRVPFIQGAANATGPQGMGPAGAGATSSTREGAPEGWSRRRDTRLVRVSPYPSWQKERAAREAALSMKLGVDTPLSDDLRITPSG